MFLFVVVSRQTKNEILCALCASAVIFLKRFLSVSMCENLGLIALNALRYAPCALLFSLGVLCVFARVVVYPIP